MDLTLRRTLPFPVDRVWSAFTDPASLAGWFWPERLRTVAEVDPRPGGAWRIAGLGMAVGGSYTELEEPYRLAFTWQWDGEEPVTTVTVTLGRGTELTLTHDGFPDEASRDDHVKGWSDCLDRLGPWLSGAAAPERAAG